MEWEVEEHSYKEPTRDWIASVVIVIASFVAVEIFFHSYLLAVLTGIAAGTLILIAHRKPNTIHVALTPTGVKAGETFYPYKTLDAYAVVTHGTHHKILLESTKIMMPLIIIPAPGDVDAEAIHAFLADHLEEKELQEPFFHLIMEKLGF